MRGDRQVLFWLGALLATVAAIAVLKDVLLPFVVGMVLAYALNPLAEMLARRGLSRAIASALVVALILVTLLLAALFLVPLLVGQLQQLVETAPGALARLRGIVEEAAKERLGERFEEFRLALDKAVAGAEIDWKRVVPAVLAALWDKGLAIFNFASLLLITPLVVFYMLVDWHPMLQRIDTWLPRDKAATIRRLAGEMDGAISAFIRGQGLVCLILGTFYAIGLSWAGLRYGLLIGLATGLLSFVPFAGWALGLIVSVAMMLVQSWPDMMPVYKTAGVLLVGMVLDSALLSPRIVGSRVGLHPLWLILALYVFSWAMGFVGMLVAVPLAAAFAVLVRYGLEVYLGSTMYKGNAPVPGAGSVGDGAAGGGTTPT